MVPHGFTRGIAHPSPRGEDVVRFYGPAQLRFSWSTFPAVSYSTVKSFKIDLKDRTKK